jgi:hypothetical protein
MKSQECPKCGFVDSEPFQECPSCGIVLDKFKNQSDPLTRIRRKRLKTQPGREESQGFSSRLTRILFYSKRQVNVPAFLGKSLLLLVVTLWGFSFFLTPVNSQTINDSFLHLINLPFHEAGHILFSVFGRFMGSLGGTLGQMLVPIICLSAFLWKKDPFSASICLWWLGQNFIDISPYIDDARAGVIPLLGGNTGQTAPYGFHDWNYLLTEAGLLEYDHNLAILSHFTGTIIMLTAVVWGFLLLLGQYQSIQSD